MMNKVTVAKQRSEYEKLKTSVEKVEKNNHSRMYAFRSGNGWCKMGWNSALIYTYVVAPMLGVEVKLKKDTDYYCQSPAGIVSIPNVEELEKRLKPLGIKVVKRTDKAVTFALPRVVTDDELSLLKNAEDEKRKRINQVLQPNDAVPSIWTGLRVVMDKVFKHYDSASYPQRAAFDQEMLDTAKAMMLKYTDFCDGIVEWGELRDFIYDGTRAISKRTLIATEVKVWSLNDATSLAELIDQLKDSVGEEDAKRVKKSGEKTEQKSGS